MKMYVAIPKEKLVDFSGIMGARLNIENDITHFVADRVYTRMELLSGDVEVLGYDDRIVRQAFTMLLHQLATLIDRKAAWNTVGVFYDQGNQQGRVFIVNQEIGHVDDTYVILEYLTEEEVLQLYDKIGNQLTNEDDEWKSAILN